MTKKNNEFVDWLSKQFKYIPGRGRASAVARLAEITPSYLSSLRKGVKKNPSKKTIEAITRAITEVRNGKTVISSMDTAPSDLQGFERMLWFVAHRRCPCCGKPQ